MPRSAPSYDALRTAVQPRRLQILETIWDRERSVTEIAGHLPVSMAAVSQHLAKLRAAGLVSVRVDGRRRYYRATKADMGALAVLLESFWTDRLSALKEMAESMERGGGQAGAIEAPRSDIPRDTNTETE